MSIQSKILYHISSFMGFVAVVLAAPGIAVFFIAIVLALWAETKE